MWSSFSSSWLKDVLHLSHLKIFICWGVSELVELFDTWIITEFLSLWVRGKLIQILLQKIIQILLQKRILRKKPLVLIYPIHQNLLVTNMWLFMKHTIKSKLYQNKIGLLLCHSHIKLRLRLRMSWDWY